MKSFFAGILWIISSNLLASMPGWITNVGPCETTVICVVGTGSNLKDAIAEGRSEIAKYFETKVKVESKVSNSTFMKNLEINQAYIDEWTSKSITEESEEMLSGIEVIKNEEINGSFYVLVSLSKEQVAKKLKNKIEAIDADNNALLSKGSRFVFPLIYLNLNKRSYLSERYDLVTNSTIKGLVNFENMIANISKLPVLKIAMVSRKEKTPISIIHLLEKIFSPLKVVFVSKKQNPNFKLLVRLNYEEQYFKVDGFKKLNVILGLEFVDKNDQVLSQTSVASNQTARNREQALEKSLEDIEVSLRENLNQLASDKIGDAK